MSLLTRDLLNLGIILQNKLCVLLCHVGPHKMNTNTTRQNLQVLPRRQHLHKSLNSCFPTGLFTNSYIHCIFTELVLHVPGGAIPHRQTCYEIILVLIVDVVHWPRSVAITSDPHASQFSFQSGTLFLNGQLDTVKNPLMQM